MIVYDRFGMHYNEIKELLTLPGIDYYPFTVFQLANPAKYNKEYIIQQGTDVKTFYKMEINWGYKSKVVSRGYSEISKLNSSQSHSWPIPPIKMLIKHELMIMLD